MNKESVMNKDVRNLNEKERFELLYQLDIDKSVFEYVKTKLTNISIQIGIRNEESVMELMSRGLLEGWCWQTTESLIVFFNDDDSIERGNLTFDVNKKYWHSWICFNFNDIVWIFDPCLRILIEKNIYYHVFEISEVAGVVNAKSVIEMLMYECGKKKSYKDESFIEKVLKEYLTEKQKKETIISGDNNVNSPMYRNNNTGYIAEIDNGRINNLYAHFYF